jgi:hypothetical protein
VFQSDRRLSLHVAAFMYRRPILCTLYGAVDFLIVLKKGCWWWWGVCYWYIVKYIMYLYMMAGK